MSAAPPELLKALQHALRDAKAARAREVQALEAVAQWRSLQHHIDLLYAELQLVHASIEVCSTSDRLAKAIEQFNRAIDD